MGQIYRGAKRVLAWLGPGGGDEETGLQLLERLSQLSKDPSTVPEIASHVIQSFFELSWFRRVWTVQECVLNVDVTLLYGRSQISLQRLISDLLIFMKSGGNSSQVALSPGSSCI